MFPISSDANEARLDACREDLDKLNERRDDQHNHRTDRNFQRSGGDPSKLFDDRPCQQLLLSSDGALDEEAHAFAEEAEDEISVIEAKLEQVGPPDKGLFNGIWNVLKAYRLHLNTIDAEDARDEDHENAD